METLATVPYGMDIDRDWSDEYLLDSEDRWRCETTCDEVLSDAIAALGRFDGRVDTLKWLEIGREEHLTLYRTVNDLNHPGRLRLLGSGFIRGSLEDVCNGLYSEDRDTFLLQESIKSNAAVLGGDILFVSSRQGPTTPFRFAGMKWLAFTTELGENRDILTYERMGMAVDEEGNNIAYHVLQSIDCPGWPVQEHLQSMNRRVQQAVPLRRTPIAMCFLYREICEGAVECFVRGDYKTRSQASSQRRTDAVMAARALLSTKVLQCAEAKKFSTLMEKARYLPPRETNVCSMCLRRPTVYDAHIECGICKKYVCEKCRGTRPIFQWGVRAATHADREFCIYCIKKAETTPVPDPTTTLRIMGHRRRRSIAARASLYPEPHNYNYDALLLKNKASIFDDKGNYSSGNSVHDNQVDAGLQMNDLKTPNESKSAPNLPLYNNATVEYNPNTKSEGTNRRWPEPRDKFGATYVERQRTVTHPTDIPTSPQHITHRASETALNHFAQTTGAPMKKKKRTKIFANLRRIFGR